MFFTSVFLVKAHPQPERARGPFLETPDNFPGPKTIFGAQYSQIAIQFSLIWKGKF